MSSLKKESYLNSIVDGYESSLNNNEPISKNSSSDKKTESYEKEAINNFLNLLNEDAINNVVSNFNCPDNVLKLIGTFEPSHYGYGFDLYKNIADHCNVSHDTLEAMSKSKLEYPRIAVAESFNTPVSILDELSNDHISHVRKAVLLNDNVSNKAIEKFKNDENSAIKSLALHINTYEDDSSNSINTSEIKQTNSDLKNSNKNRVR